MRYWRTVLSYTPNLVKFAYRLFSIPPSSATSERVWSLMSNIYTERHNRLSSKKAVKMAQITWYIREQFFVNKSKKAQDSLDSLKVYNELNNIDDDDISNRDEVNVDEMMDDLEQISARIINDINVFNSIDDVSLQSPTLFELFDLQIIEIVLIQEINSI